MSAALLLLFDIDGTLIRERPLMHQRAMLAAVERVYELEFGDDETPIASARSQCCASWPSPATRSRC